MPGETLNRLPCLGRIVGQQLVRHHLVHCHVQPRVDGLAVDDHVFLTVQGVRELQVQRLDQNCALVLVARIKQLEVESSVDPVRTGKRPRPPVTGLRLVEPAIRCLLLVPGCFATSRHPSQVRSARARAGPPGLMVGGRRGDGVES